VTENPKDEVSVIASVIRLERNAAHPQVALQLVEGMRDWKKKVWEYAGSILTAREPEPLDDWMRRSCPSSVASCRRRSRPAVLPTTDH